MKRFQVQCYGKYQQMKNYLIDYKYFNNLNEDEDGDEYYGACIGIGTRQICTYSSSFSYPIEKIGYYITYIHTQSMQKLSVKTGTSSKNTHGDEFICHP